jgi:hypothetical protein
MGRKALVFVLPWILVSSPSHGSSKATLLRNSVPGSHGGDGHRRWPHSGDVHEDATRVLVYALLDWILIVLLLANGYSRVPHWLAYARKEKNRIGKLGTDAGCGYLRADGFFYFWLRVNREKRLGIVWGTIFKV